MEFEVVLRDGVEYRFDPLTGEQTRINPARARRLKQAESDVEWEGIIARSREACVFCPEQIEQKIQFIFKESSLAELTEGAIDGFAHAITKALCAYKEIGIGSFNLITYSGPLPEKLDSYRLHASLFSRPSPRGVYTNDTGPMERGYDVWVIDTVPEELADRMKPFFA